MQKLWGVKIMFCPKCGNYTGEDKICAYCGTVVSESPATQHGSADLSYNLSSYPDDCVDVDVGNIQAKPLGLFSAYRSMLKNSYNFSGRSRRSEFWCVLIDHFSILFVPCAILLDIYKKILISKLNEVIHIFYTPTNDDPNIPKISFYEVTETDRKILVVFLVIVSVYVLSMFVGWLSLSIRRLHDINHSGWIFLLNLIPVVGNIVFMYLCTRDSTPGPNKYGPNPKCK